MCNYAFNPYLLTCYDFCVSVIEICYLIHLRCMINENSSRVKILGAGKCPSQFLFVTR